MPYKFRDMKWSEMDDKQQEKAGSKSEHKAAKEKAQAKLAESESTTSSTNTANTNTTTEAKVAPTPAHTGAKNDDQDISKRYYQNYSDLTEEQKAKSGTKEEHSAYRQDAGLKGYNGSKKDYNAKKSGQTADYNVDSLDNFDLTAGGAGAQRGEARLSSKDLKGLDESGNFSREELIAYADDVSQSFGDNDKGYGNKAQKLLDKWKAGLTDGGTPTPDPTPDPEPDNPNPGNPNPGNPNPGNPNPGNPNPGNPNPGNPNPGNPNPGNPGNPNPGIDTGGGDLINDGEINQGGNGGDNVNEDIGNQDVTVTQDNDITTNITGDGNSVWNNQDNSVNTYGGDNRIFNYNPGGNAGDGGGSWFGGAPVSAATAAGFYEVNDSPAKQAEFVGLHTDLNRQNQMRYAGSGAAIANMFSNFDARAYTPESMENKINDSIQSSYDKADLQTAYTFGDIWSEGYAPDKWVMPDPPAKIELPDDLGDDERDDIENM